MRNFVITVLIVRHAVGEASSGKQSSKQYRYGRLIVLIQLIQIFAKIIAYVDTWRFLLSPLHLCLYLLPTK